MATLGRRTEAAALSSALAPVAGSGRGVQGLTTTPHGLYVCFLAGWEGMFATDGAVAPGHEALGTDDLGGHRLNSQSTAMSPEGEIKPTRSQTKTPIGRVGTEKVRVQRGILFQNCMKRLKICVIEKSHKPGQPPERLPFWPEERLVPGMRDRRAGRQGGVCARGLTWRVTLQNRLHLV